MDKTYWTRFWKQRISRKRLLQGSAVGATGLAAAAVFGCSDDEEDSGTPTSTGQAGTTPRTGGGYPDQGISDTEVRVGGTWPLTGPILSSPAIAESAKAYFDFINAKGGVNGRKISYFYYDDQYNPAQTVEQSRRLLTQDKVFALAGGLGTAQQNAVISLAEQAQTPHLYINTTASIFLDPKKHPWTTTAVSLAPYFGYGALYGSYINGEMPNAKVAVLYQNDDLGKDYLKGIKSTLKSPAAVVSEQSYEPTDQDLSAQVLAMKNSNADVWLSASVLRPHVLALKAAGTIAWKPQIFLSHANVALIAIQSQNLGAAYTGAIGFFSSKDVADPQWANDAAFADAKKVVDAHAPNINRQDSSWATGQIWPAAFADALKRMKGNTRQDLLDAVRATKGFDGAGLLLPGVVANGSKDTNIMLKQGKLGKFNGTRFENFGGTLETPLPPTA